MDNFARAYLVARDGGRTAEESWCSREQSAQRFEVGFTAPLEWLSAAQFEECLLLAARSGAYYALFHFKHTLPFDAAQEAVFRYFTAYLKPLYERHVIGGSALLIDVRGGYFHVGLFNIRDIPAEHRQLVSADDGHRLLAEAGFEPAEPPDQKTH